MLKKLVGLIWVFGLLNSANLYSQSLFLKVEGANENETKTIDTLTYKKQFQDFASIALEIKELKHRAERKGYLEVEIEPTEKENDSTYLVPFRLGNRYRSIRIFYGVGMLDKKTLSLLSEHVTDGFFEIPFEKLEETLGFLNSSFIEKGDPFATLQIQNIERHDNLTLSGTLVTSEQAQRTIDTIIVKGYEKFPKSFVKHHLKLKPKQPLSLKKINERASRLDDLQFANQIKDPELLFTNDSTSLYIYVEKAKSNTFDGFLGFGNNEETNNIQFNGYLNLGLVNNFNFGESFKLYYKSDENEQRTFDLEIVLPYLLGSPLGTELRLNIFKKDSSFVTASQSVKFIYPLNSRNSVSFGLLSETSNNLLDNTTVFIKDYRSLFYMVNYVHVRPQRFDALFPVNFLFDLTLGTGNRTTNDSKNRQARVQLETFKIFNLNERNSIFSRITSSILTSEDYLDNELLRFGGINSIRGFEENSLLANLYAVINTEYRYRLSSSLYVNSVVDLAYFENKNLTAKEKIYGFGFGFGLLTQAGLLKLNFSSGTTENQPVGFSNSKIHISLSSTF